MKGFHQKQQGFCVTYLHEVVALLAALAVVSYILYPRVQSHRYADDQVSTAHVVAERVSQKVPADQVFEVRNLGDALEKGVLTKDMLHTPGGIVGWRPSKTDGAPCTSGENCQWYIVEWEPGAKHLCAQLAVSLVRVATQVQIGTTKFPGFSREGASSLTQVEEKAMRQACYDQKGATVAAVFLPHQ